MKSLLLGFFMLTTLISCTSSQSECADCEPVPPQLMIRPTGEGYKNGSISVGHSVQWEAVLLTLPTPTPFPSDHLTWTAKRGAITGSGLFTAPDSPTTDGFSDWIKAVRNDVPNSQYDNHQDMAYFQVVRTPSIQIFSSPTPMPVATAAPVTLTFQFADGSGELYTGNTLVQSSLQSGGSSTVHPIATTTYTLKVTNQAGDSVSRDLTITVL